ncbi:MAG: cupin domain-containing protein [Planctomycetaceae bacterium]|nr:cupin domain-containing protein [Planctomycetaceae bacterium]
MNGNILANLPTGLPTELVDVLEQNSALRIERIISTGQSSPPGFWYDQEECEWVLLLAGAAELRFDDGEIRRMTPGDQVMIAAHRRHRVDWTAGNEPTVWLAVFWRPQ